MNKLRDRIIKIGNQLTAVTRRQNNHERFMEEIAVQVNAQEERLAEIQGYTAIRPESVCTPVRRLHNPTPSFHKAIESTHQQEALPKKACHQLPKPFKGKRKGGEAEVFAIKMDLFFNEYPIFQEEPHRKITQFLLRMKEGSEASKWAQPLMKRYTQ